MPMWMYRLLLLSTLGSSLLGADPPPAREEAMLTLDAADGEPAQLCQTTDNLLVSGRVSPGFPYREAAVVQLFHLREETAWVPLGVVETPLDDKGRFSLSIHPPPSGWMPGLFRVVVTVQHIRRLRESYDLMMVAPAEGSSSKGTVPPMTLEPLPTTEKPALLLNGVNRDKPERYWVQANVLVMGQVNAKVLRGETVQVRLFQVVDDATWVPQGRVDVPILPDGKFQVSVRPRAAGWPAGRFRVIAALDPPARGHDSFEIEMIDDRKERDLSDGSIAPTVDSGIVYDLEDERPASVVPAKQEFHVRGRLLWEGGRPGEFNWSVMVKVTHGAGGAIAQNAAGRCYCEAPGTWWFELPLVAPQPGNYRLTVRGPLSNNSKLPGNALVFSGDLHVAPAEPVAMP
jgi:hypothetical protein